MEQIIIDIDASGDVKVEAKGVKGAGCHRLTQEIEAAIGRTNSDIKTPEFHQGAVCQIPNQVKASQ